MEERSNAAEKRMIYDSERGDIAIVAVGDVMLTRRLTPFTEPQFLALVELVRGGDANFFNLETAVRLPDEGAPIVTRGTIMTTPPALLDDIKWMGFNLAGAANNHVTDYGQGGVLAAVAHMRVAGIPCSGMGTTLGQARAPAYLDTRNGRVAVVAATSFFPEGARAGDPRSDSSGRPGISTLGFSKTYTVDEEGASALRRLSDKLGYRKIQEHRARSFFSKSEAMLDDENSFVFLDARFRRGNGFAVTTTANRKDAAGILRQIAEARRQADWVIFSFHNHELASVGDGSIPHFDVPADFARDFAREAIDAGADMVAGHGHHMTLGVETYKGRPIFHSLGNFIMENDTVESVPADAYDRFDLGHDATPADFLDARTGNETRGFPASEEYWHALLARCEYRNHRPAAIRLYPCDLGFRLSRAQRGRPVLAHGDVAQRILERTRVLSEHLGTRVTIDRDTAWIALE
jgi:poly-gamma-glutamate capsule biosynthesis protein CapA/YwtB (metallophosphatase superfamily)